MAARFSVFANRNFRLFWVGLLVSMIGTVVQIIAQSWLVYTLTHSPFLLGLVGAAQAVPFLLLSLIGGNTADRVDKRSLLYITQSIMMILAFILGVLAATGKVEVWHVALIAVGMGIANSFDMPTRLAFVYELVGKEDIMSAVSLNSMLFNLAQISGPAIAGIVVSTIGNSWCFFLNAVSFLAFIVALKMMKLLPSPERKMEDSTFKNITEGLRYVRATPVLRSVIVIAALCSIFVMPYGVLMPVFAGDVLKVGAKGFGFLMTCTGIGALAGGLIIAGAGDIRRKGRLLFTGATVFSAAILLFSFSRIFYLSCIFLVISGFFFLFQSSISDTIVQITTPDEMRGRIMGIYSLAFMGLSPLGSLQMGTLAQFFGAPFAIGLGTLVFGVSVLFLFRKTPQLREI